MMVHRTVILLISIFIQLNHGTYLPTLFWDTSNPILQRRYWHKVVNVKIFDFINFVCPNENIKLGGTEKTGMDSLYHNLYVKEIPADIKNFEGACDTSENSTAIFIRNCENPKNFIYQNIEINLNQADPSLPKFLYRKDYMFFATSDGTKESLRTKSKNCTMVFRIHFSKNKNQVTYPSCPLFDRKNVCNDSSNQNSWNTDIKECKNMIPEELNTTVTAKNNVIVTWKNPRKIPCNITFYTVCYRENMTQPCQEILVPAKQRRVTLWDMAADKSYFIQVRAHTDKGPSEYCEKKTFTTGVVEEANVLEQKEEPSSSLDGKSIAIGFVLGVFLTFAGGIIFWFFVRRIYKKKVRGEKKENSTSKNNPNFYKGDETTGDVLQLNCGYRESGQNWKLPPLREENTRLHVSEA